MMENNEHADDNSQHAEDTSLVETGETDGEFAGEERTIFCAGFPPDVKYREIRNLFRFLDGFMHCVLNLKGKGPTAFASFINEDFSQTAMELLNGIRFDEENYPNLEIRTQLAKTNIKKPGTTIHNPPGTDPLKDGNIYGTHYGGPHSNQRSFYNLNLRNTPTSPNEITTIFVANLSVTCTEKSMRELFNREGGFREIKFNPPKTPKSTPVAFVDFLDHGSAVRAINKFNGLRITGSTSGIKVQLAKQNMGNEKKRGNSGGSRGMPPPMMPPPTVPYVIGLGMPGQYPYRPQNLY